MLFYNSNDRNSGDVWDFWTTFESQHPQIHQGDISSAKAEDGNYKMDRPHVFDKIGPTIFVLELSHALSYEICTIHILPLISYGLLQIN